MILPVMVNPLRDFTTPEKVGFNLTSLNMYIKRNNNQ